MNKPTILSLCRPFINDHLKINKNRSTPTGRSVLVSMIQSFPHESFHFLCCNNNFINGYDAYVRYFRNHFSSGFAPSRHRCITVNDGTFADRRDVHVHPLFYETLLELLQSDFPSRPITEIIIDQFSVDEGITDITCILYPEACSNLAFGSIGAADASAVDPEDCALAVELVDAFPELLAELFPFPPMRTTQSTAIADVLTPNVFFKLIFMYSPPVSDLRYVFILSKPLTPLLFQTSDIAYTFTNPYGIRYSCGVMPVSFLKNLLK